MDIDSITSISLNFIYTSHLNCQECQKLTGDLHLEDKYVQLDCDEETEEFIRTCHNSTFQLFKASFLVNFLKPFYTLQDANAILGLGKMFMLSTKQLQILFDNQKFNSLLDIGAGDGHVTQKLKSIITGEIACTEVSTKLQVVLQKQGFTIQNEIEGEFELVSCLNVLDRCEKPITMLKQILQVKKKYVLISLVFPFSGFYYKGIQKYLQVEEFIGYHKHWEENVHLAAQKFIELGFQIEKISRVPYLSEGNFKKSLYYLDTAVFILS